MDWSILQEDERMKKKGVTIAVAGAGMVVAGVVGVDVEGETMIVVDILT